MTNLKTGSNLPNSMPAVPSSAPANIDDIQAAVSQGAPPPANAAVAAQGTDTFEKSDENPNVKAEQSKKTEKTEKTEQLKVTPADIAKLDEECAKIQGYQNNKHVTTAFKEEVIRVADRLKMEPKVLIAIMAYETGGSFDPKQKNNGGSGATGLIQFMPSTAKRLGTTTEALAGMSAVGQMKYVEGYLKPYTGKLDTVSDAYMAVLWPAAVGKLDSHVLMRKDTKVYNQNKGLDLNDDGVITRKEASHRVRKFLGEVE